MHITDTTADQQVPLCCCVSWICLAAIPQWEESRLQTCKGLTVEQSRHSSWSMSTISQPESKSMLSMHAAFKQTRGSTLCVPQCAQTCFWQWQGTGNDLSQCPQHSSSSCSFWTFSLQLQPHPSPCHQPCQLPLGLQLLPAQQLTMQNRPNLSQIPVNLQLGSATSCCIGNYSVPHILSMAAPKDGALPLVLISSGVICLLLSLG